VLINSFKIVRDLYGKEALTADTSPSSEIRIGQDIIVSARDMVLFEGRVDSLTFKINENEVLVQRIKSETLYGSTS